jgi:hypothetical protein
MQRTRSFVSLAAAALVVMNLIDGLMTLVWVQAGVASEGNPLMDRMMAHGPVGFMLIKLSLVSLGVLLLWRLRHRRAAAAGLVGAAAIYSSILVVHLSVARHVVMAAL